MYVKKLQMTLLKFFYQTGPKYLSKHELIGPSSNEKLLDIFKLLYKYIIFSLIWMISPNMNLISMIYYLYEI